MFDFLTEAQCGLLRAQGLASQVHEGFDPLPVVKLFTPDAGATWLLSELDPFDEDRAYGLCDAGLGCPELGWVRLTELAWVRGIHGPGDCAGCALRAGAAAECLCARGAAGRAHPGIAAMATAVPGAPAGFSGIGCVTALGASRRPSPPLRIRGSEPDSLSIG